MNAFDWIDHSFSYRLITTLLHFLWQGTLVALLAFVGDWLLRRASAHCRYCMHLAAMMTIIACVLITFLNVSSPVEFVSVSVTAPPIVASSQLTASHRHDVESSDGPMTVIPSIVEREIPAPIAVEAGGGFGMVPGPAAPQQLPARKIDYRQLLQQYSPQITVIYFVCCGLLLARLIRGTWAAHRLRGRGITVIDDTLIVAIQRQSQELGLRYIPRLVWCAEVSIPLVIGIIKPMILLPAAAATGLSPDQLQALITHELAHIRRYDLLVNLVQRVVESMLFFHPAVWYVSRRISSEREQACDDLVLATGCERLRYADALVRMAELSSSLRRQRTSAPVTSLAASGTNSSEFKRRVLRVLSAPTTTDMRPSRVGLLFTVAVIAGAAMSASRSHFSVLAETPPQPTPAKTTAPNGLEFLAAYPKLRELSLDMTEAQFLDVIKTQELRNRKTIDREKARYEIPLGDLHVLIVMFHQDGKCRGIQRVRGEDGGTQNNQVAETTDQEGPQDDNEIGENSRLAVELEAFQGTWAMDICDSETKDFGESQSVVRNWRWAIHNNRVKWSRSNGEIWNLSFGVDPMKFPKEINVTFLDGPYKGETCEGIYQWGGTNQKMLQISMQDPGTEPPRPKSISMTSGGQTSLIFLQPVPPDEAEKELASVQGTWQFEIIQTDAWPKPMGKGPDRFGQGDNRQWIVNGNEITWIGPDGEEVKLSFTIDPARAPKQLDVTFLNGPHEGMQCEGIYERGGVGGAILWLCLSDPGARGPRPSDVSYSTGQGRTMIGLRRVVPASKTEDQVRRLRNPSVLLPDHWIMQAVEFDREGKELVTISNQSFITIRRWDVVAMRLISEIKLQADQHGRAFREGTFRFSGDRNRVIGATDAYVGIWDATTGTLLKQLPFETKNGIYDCAIDLLDCTPDLSLIAGHRSLPGRLTLSFDAPVIVWDGTTGNVLRTVIDKGATNLIALDLSTDGKRLVTTNGSGAKIWDTGTGQLIRSIANDNTGRKHSDPDISSQHTNHVWSVQLSPDGHQLALGDTLGVKLIDVSSGELLKQLEGSYRFSSSRSPALVFSKDGQFLARLGTQEKTDPDKHRYVVPIWSTRTSKRLFDLHTEANAAVFSDDGQRLAVAFSDLQQALSVWSLNHDAVTIDKPAGPGPHSRQDRVEENGHYVGKVAAEYIEKFKPTWGDAKLGLQYGIAFTTQDQQFRAGERVPLVVFFRNASEKPIKFDTAPDFFGNTPNVLNSKGESISLENISLLGSVPRYHEQLEPGEALGPFYLSFGLGENPLPGMQHWHAFLKNPVAGTYTLTHAASFNIPGTNKGKGATKDVISTGVIPFEIVK